MGSHRSAASDASAQRGPFGRPLEQLRRLHAPELGDIRQNLTLALQDNALAVPVAAGVLYPWIGLLLGPMLAAAATSLSSVSVIMNALRLRRAL